MHHKAQLFEWESLQVGKILPGEDNVKFKQKHFDLLVKWQETQKKTFFKVGFKKITFTQWVGVIQVEELTIEIIPKAEKKSIQGRDETLKKWNCILLRMLKKTGQIKLRTNSSTNLSLKNQSLLDIYLQCFLDEVETLIHRGLIKKYLKKSKNRSALKGKLLFEKNLIHNLVHRERFYSEANEYERENIWNQIINEALKLVFKNSHNGSIRSKAKELELYFSDWPNRSFTDLDFQSLNYDRKSDGYQEVMKYARLILLGLNPQIQSGATEVLAIFFDMNDLFERYIAKILKQQLQNGLFLKEQGPQKDLLLNKGNQKFNEKSFRLKPDIVIQSKECFHAILDTKWKNLVEGEKKLGVSQMDLYQLYTYAGEYECTSLALIYPKWGEQADLQEYEYQVGPCLNTKIRLIPWDWSLEDKVWAEQTLRVM